MAELVAPGRTVFAADAPVVAVASGPDADAVALGDGRVALFTPAAQTPSHVTPPQPGAVLALAHHAPSRSFLTGGEDGSVRRVDEQGRVSLVARLGSRWVERLAVEPASGAWAASSGRELYVFGPDDAPRLQRRLPSAPGLIGVDRLRGRLAIPHYDGVTLTPLHPAAEDAAERVTWRGSHLAAAVSPNGRWLASGMQENALHVWPLQGGAEDLGMRGYAGKPTSLAWSADSRVLVSSGADTLVAWAFDPAGPAGRPLLVLGATEGARVTVVCAHPHARLVAAGFDTGAAILADLDTRRIARLEAATGRAVTALAWSHDGARLILGWQEGGAALHDTSADGLKASVGSQKRWNARSRQTLPGARGREPPHPRGAGDQLPRRR